MNCPECGRPMRENLPFGHHGCPHCNLLFEGASPVPRKKDERKCPKIDYKNLMVMISFFQNDMGKVRHPSYPSGRKKHFNP